MRKGYWFLLSLVLIGIDQASKYWVSHAFAPYDPVPVMPMLNITLAFNTGAAFSFLSSSGEWHRWFFAGFSLVMSAILAIWLYRLKREDQWQALGLSFILGGAVGNLIDRAIHGYVIDFIDVYYQHHHFATFNIADSAICIGAFFFVLDLLFAKKSV